MPTMQSALMLERARVRDLLRYYTPAANRALPPASAPANLRAGSHDAHDAHDAHNAHAKASSCSIATPLDVLDDGGPDDSRLLVHDSTLAALCQLAAFRLNTDRCLISLMDHDKQYILAEATRSVSINAPNSGRGTSGDAVFLGPRILGSVWGVCPATIAVFTQPGHALDVSNSLMIANSDSYVMNDLSAMEQFKDRPYVRNWPHLKFYAEVPIRSPTGFVIGTFCVVDSKPRDAGLDKAGFDALNEIAGSVMQHLASVREQQNLRRSAAMIKGLGLFTEGKASVSEWWSDDPAPDTSTRPWHSPRGTVVTLPSDTDLQSHRTPSAMTEQGQRSDSKEHSQRSHSKEHGQRSDSKAQGQRSDSKEPESSDARDDSQSGLNRRLSSDTRSDESLASLGIRALFTRASNLIREALDLDGIVFVDACEHEHDAHLRTSAQKDPTKGARKFTPTSDGQSESIRQNSQSPAGDRVQDSFEVPQSLEGNLLGHSCQTSKIAHSFLKNLPQSTVRGLLKRYRHGLILELDEVGTVMQIEDGTVSKASARAREREQLWAHQLLEVCPDARTILFFPLWDSQRDKWYAGGFAWINDATKVLISEDLNYLAAFGSCIMAEKSRLDALLADRAKSDFISSVSHELRSPLHGVLASAEALEEISAGPHQDDMIRSIKICGEVLLDTMDHILEYAKMSNTKAEIASLQGSNQSNKQITDFDLSKLLENVVEGIMAGKNYRTLTPEVPNSIDFDPNIFERGSSTDLTKIITILSIDWKPSWVISSQIGALKRIIMNIFGNALKYTEKGFICCSLQADESEITLHIQDSGKGISKAYLKYELYTPFVQEDPVSTGTGLGLSIVRQLVTDLGGKIDIQSELGYGTDVKVCIPFTKPTADKDAIPDPNSQNRNINQSCVGRTLSIVGCDVCPPSEAPTGINSIRERQMLSLRSSLVSLGADWFGMDVITSNTLESAPGDFLICMRSHLTPELQYKRPLIVLEDVVGVNSAIESEGLFILLQPIGPRKLARVLQQCLDYMSTQSMFSTPLEYPVRELAPQVQQIQHSAGEPMTPPLSIDFENINLPSKALQGDLSVATSFPFLVDRTRQASNTASASKIEGKSMISTSVEVPKSDTVQVAALGDTLDVSASTEPLPVGKDTVLLVEDNGINMKVLVNFMNRSKQKILSAVNGLEATQQYQANHADIKIIFMDIQMPVMDGLAATRKIRAFEQENGLERVNIVALTCFSSEEYKNDAKKSGVDLFLIKPVPMKSLRPILDMREGGAGRRKSDEGV